MPNLFVDEQKALDATKAAYEHQLTELYAEIGKLTTQLAWLKKKVLSLTRPERLALVEYAANELSLTAQADVLGISRSSLYYHPVPLSPEEVRIKHRIDAIYTQYPFYGSRRIAAQLQREEVSISRTTVQRYMQEMGIAGISPGPKLSQRQPEHPVYPYLLRHITSQYPNHVWGIDITYIRLRAGWMYLVLFWIGSRAIL